VWICRKSTCFYYCFFSISDWVNPAEYERFLNKFFLTKSISCEDGFSVYSVWVVVLHERSQNRLFQEQNNFRIDAWRTSFTTTMQAWRRRRQDKKSAGNSQSLLQFHDRSWASHAIILNRINLWQNRRGILKKLKSAEISASLTSAETLHVLSVRARPAESLLWITKRHIR